MIKLSRLADYAVVIMGNFATNDSVLLSAQQLSKHTHLPHATVSKILKKLLNAKLLTSTQGMNGGYSLARTPDMISVSDIITAVDGPVYLTECTNHISGNCKFTDECHVKQGVHRINDVIQNTLQNMSLTELITPPPHTNHMSGGGKL